MNGKKWGLALAILLMLAGGAGAYYAFRTDPKLAAALDLQKQMQNDDLPREERGKLWGQMREAMENLTPEQRQQVFQQMGRGRDGFMARGQKKMDEFFAMAKKDQIKVIDKRIDEMVKDQKEREKRRKQRDQQRQQSGDTNGAAGQGGGFGGGGRGGPGGGGGGGGSGDRGLDRRLRMDSMGAGQRAQMSEFGRMFADRMSQRGIPMTGGGGRGPRGF